VDGRIFKDIKFKGATLQIFMEVYNLFNFNNPITVYEGSGSPDEPLYELTAGSLSPDIYREGESSMYSKWADFNKDGFVTTSERLEAFQIFEDDMLSMKTNYQFPRTLMFGMSINF
jgi:hypothetical protein